MKRGHQTLLSSFPYTFLYPPLLVGRGAMNYYGLRDAGQDLDFVVSKEDFERLHERYPDQYSIGDFGDERVILGTYECYATFLKVSYHALVKGAIVEQDHLIIALPSLHCLSVKVWDADLGNEQRKHDVMLLVEKLRL